MTVQAWAGLHPKQQRHPGHGTRRPRPIVRGTILRVQVQRVPAPHPPAEGAVAVVGRPGRVRSGSGLAGLHPPVRPGAHRPVCQADPRLDDPAPSHARAGRPLDLAGAGRLHPAAPGPRHRRRPAAAVGTAPTAATAVTAAGAARVSAAAVRTGLASEYAETRRALPRPAQGPLLGTCRASPSDQEASQETQEQAAQDHKGHLRAQPHPPRPPTTVDGQPGIPWVKSQAKSLSKSSRVVVMGRLQQRAWTAEDGSARSTVEVVADELGPSLRWATMTTTRATRTQSQ